ncbi:MAG: hypothetical protein HN909_07845 [Phycisphaerales bacterium]|nr:hypothetical protein [Phycisphaerales bacterium]MBT7171667.1 hypothetical protein [Phycisphaerales bacterium]
MQLKQVLLMATIGLLAPLALGERYEESRAKQLFLRECSTCHTISNYDMSNRSLKEWQLVIERMKEYGGDDLYTDDEAAQIATFLYSAKHHPLMKLDQVIPITDDEPVTPDLAGEETHAKPEEKPKPEIIMSWRKSKATGVAKFMAYVAFGAMALLVLSGLARKTLKRNFRPIHTVLAITLFGALAIHASVYLCEYGVPSVLWLWFGIIASVVIALGEFGGLVRGKLGRKFVPIHATCGVVGFVLVVLHWLWIYM